MTKPNDLKNLDLPELRNLFLKESREFLAALEFETFDQLQLRRERIREIDEEIVKRKLSPSRS